MLLLVTNSVVFLGRVGERGRDEGAVRRMFKFSVKIS
jgi:hypothetical protein